MATIVRTVPDAPDPTTPVVTVQFMLVSGLPNFLITPPSVARRGAGNIQFTIANGSAPGTQFIGFAVKSNSPNQDPNHTIFDSTTFAQNGTRMIVHDRNTVQQGGTALEYDYSIGVECNNAQFWSDPKIINDPPPGPGAFAITLRARPKMQPA